MPVTDAVLRGYREGIDPDSVLGYITGYTIQADTQIPHDQFVEYLRAHDLSDKINRPRDEDAFKRVTTDAKKKRVPVEGSDNLWDEYLIRDLGTTTSSIERRIVRERLEITEKLTGRGKAKKVSEVIKRLDYEEMHTISFNRSTAKLTVKSPAKIDPIARGIVKEIREQYVSWRGCLNDWAVRNHVRRTIAGLDALPILASGGTYFVTTEHLKVLANLEQFVDDLPGDSTVAIIPLVDSKKQRKMIRQAFEEETVTAANNLIERINEIRNSGRPIRSDLLKNLQAEFDEITEKIKRYEKLLETTTTVGRNQAKVMAAKLITLRKAREAA